MNVTGGLLEKFLNERNLSKESKNGYRIVVNSFCKFNKMTLEELINEARDEEKQNIGLKNHAVKKRLRDYVNYLENDLNLELNTIKSYSDKVKTFYRHFGIQIPKIPMVIFENEKSKKFGEALTKKDIRDALKITNKLLYKALILFISSSGIPLIDITSLDIKDFIEATKEYHNKDNIKNIIKTLRRRNDIVPLFKVSNKKVDYYYTCCSPEAVEMTLIYLNTRKNLKEEDQLFEVNKDTASSFFQNINHRLGWGKVKNRSFFNVMGLRKFHESMVKDKDLVKILQGAKAAEISNKYLKLNPKKIREEYIKYLPKLIIEEVKVITIKSKE